MGSWKKGTVGSQGAAVEEKTGLEADGKSAGEETGTWPGPQHYSFLFPSFLSPINVGH